MYICPTYRNYKPFITIRGPPCIDVALSDFRSAILDRASKSSKALKVANMKKTDNQEHGVFSK